MKALKQGDTATVSALIDADAELLERRGMWENTPLLVACHYGHTACALMLLERGADATASNEAGATALLFACVESMSEVTAQLLARPAVLVEPSAASVYTRSTDESTARTPLQSAAENGFRQGVDGLLARGAAADPTALRLSLIHI